MRKGYDADGTFAQHLTEGTTDMKRLMLAVPLALAACNSSPTVTAENASVEEVAEKVAAARGDTPFISPGRWESTVTIKEVSMPGLPPEATAQMKAQMGKSQSVISCVTEADVKKPSADFFAGGASKDCRYDRFAMAGGKVDAAMTCNRGGASQKMKMTGSYSPESYNMAMESQASGAGAPGTMTMKMEMAATRAGECRGDEMNKKGAAQ
jgi:Protein of unknown function (DUF3617)